MLMQLLILRRPSPLMRETMGPPESPWQASVPCDPLAHRVCSVMDLRLYLSKHSELSQTVTLASMTTLGYPEWVRPQPMTEAS